MLIDPEYSRGEYELACEDVKPHGKRKGNNSGINEITKRHVGETLWREVCVVHHCLVPGQLIQGQGQSPYMHCGAARGGPYRLEERGMKLEGSEEINDAIYCTRNSIQLLGICEMLLSQLKETTSHGLKWSNSPTLLSSFVCDWLTGSNFLSADLIIVQEMED
ncbi:hypothetical protein RRG08_031498 [Elysia crispata]|uniref:Uncharacterized protein n=1 Tax=Elysia crispata TaxID=231223 RepID=A0AAE0YZ69_9GAST|nr:hypothetical protein RRG08_031498 [Elysia crispata]